LLRCGRVALRDHPLAARGATGAVGTHRALAEAGRRLPGDLADRRVGGRGARLERLGRDDVVEPLRRGAEPEAAARRRILARMVRDAHRGGRDLVLGARAAGRGAWSVELTDNVWSVGS